MCVTNYDKFLELDNVTIEDCVDLFDKKNMTTIINDGRILGFEDKV